MVDWLAFVVVSALGVPVISANLFGRVVGAVFGFFLNRKYTFGGGLGSGRPMRRELVRFAIGWVLMAFASTLMVSGVAEFDSLRGAWLAKPVIDGLLAVLGFVVSKYWIFNEPKRD